MRVYYLDWSGWELGWLVVFSYSVLCPLYRSIGSSNVLTMLHVTNAMVYNSSGDCPRTPDPALSTPISKEMLYASLHSAWCALVECR